MNEIKMFPHDVTRMMQANWKRHRVKQSVSPALGSYAAGSSLDVTVHVSVTCVIPLLGEGADLRQARKRQANLNCTYIHTYITTMN